MISEYGLNGIIEFMDFSQSGLFPSIQSQSSRLINSQESFPNAGQSSQRTIPLFSKKTPMPQTTLYNNVSFSSSRKQTIGECHNPINATYNRITSDPNFNYKSISEVPEEFRTIFSHFPHFNKVQSKVFDDVLYSDNPIVLSAPTGSGKTVVFELAIVRCLIQTPCQEVPKIKIVYMAPLKALCSERLSDWKNKFSPFSVKCLEVTGDSDVDDYSAIKNANLIFTTPEKWDSVTRKWKEHVSQMEYILLFLVDEVHMIGDMERGSTIEAVISRMKCIKDVTKSSLRFVAVSATIPNPEDFASWLSSSDTNSVCFKLDESYRPVPLQKVVLSFGDCTTSTAFKFDLNLNYKLHNIIQQYSSKCPTIVFCSTRKSTVQAATTLQNQKRFVFNENDRQHIRELVGNVVDCKLRDLLVSGVGYHHAGLTPSDRKVVENLFTAGYLPVICATSTLAMGVNLPAHLVIIKSTIHYAGGKFREYSSTDILQMIGRAGRPQFDTSAVAVIMTQNSTKSLYSNLISGTQVIESNIHHNLTEHLNSEIVLKTLTHLKIATQWMTSLFLYVRITKNPVRYGLPAQVTSSQIKKFLHDAVMNGINSLQQQNFIIFMSNGEISPTDSGSLMARYCISFSTMKKLSELKGDESLPGLLEVLSTSHEFSDVQLRVQEKSSLNLLNKNKNGPVIRYPFKDKVKTSGMKVSVLIQAVLGCIPINDFALNQESIRIVQVAARVSKCLLEFQAHIPSFLCYVNCLLLMKSLNCKLWENSKFVTRQLKNVGATFGNLLANAGIVTLQKLISTEPRELELITNKNPPFGTDLIEQASKLPQYELFVQQTGDLDKAKATIQVIVKPKHIIEPPVNTFSSLIIGTPENVLLCKRKFKDRSIFDSKFFQCEINVYRSVKEQSVIFWLISHSFVGADIKSKFTPKFVEDPSFLEVGNNTSMSKQTQILPNRSKQSANPYLKPKEPHLLKMDQKLSDSSRIVVGNGKNINKTFMQQDVPKVPSNPPDDNSDDSFDDLPEINWKIKEIIEPPQINNPKPSGSSVQHKVTTSTVRPEEASITKAQSGKMLMVKPILKAPKSNNNLAPTEKQNYMDIIMQDMEDSGYFDDFDGVKSFDVGVDELLGESLKSDNKTNNIDYGGSFRKLELQEAAVQKQPETSVTVIRVDENGDQFRECGHKCSDKTTCSHFCCRFGVKVKLSSKRSSADAELGVTKPAKIHRTNEYFSKIPSPTKISKTENFRLTNHKSTVNNPYIRSNREQWRDPHKTTEGNDKVLQIKNGFYTKSHSNASTIYAYKTQSEQSSRIDQNVKPSSVQSFPEKIINDISKESVNLSNVKEKYDKAISDSTTSKSVPQTFQATQPPKFSSNVGFYNSQIPKSSSSSFSSIFDGIL